MRRAKSPEVIRWMSLPGPSHKEQMGNFKSHFYICKSSVSFSFFFFLYNYCKIQTLRLAAVIFRSGLYSCTSLWVNTCCLAVFRHNSLSHPLTKNISRHLLPSALWKTLMESRNNNDPQSANTTRRPANNTTRTLRYA